MLSNTKELQKYKAEKLRTLYSQLSKMLKSGFRLCLSSKLNGMCVSFRKLSRNYNNLLKSTFT